MRLIISGGGSGGHVYPALAVVQKLKQQLDKLDILWVGSHRGMEQTLVPRAGLKIEAVAATGLRGKNPLALPGRLAVLARGYRQSRRLIDRFQPDRVLVTGGYVCVPVTLAAYRAGIPILIYLPDLEPGFAIKFLARFANQVAVTSAESQRFFKPGLTVVTGYPVREELFLGQQPGTKAEARRRLGLDESRPVLLVFGGSQGARSINQALSHHLEACLQVCQVVHLSGRLDEAWLQQRRTQLPPALQQDYHLRAYLHQEMIDALLAADLVVSRAGASVLGEFPAAGLPAVLVPYPYAGAHQALNARYLAQHQAALVVNDADLDRQFEAVVIGLITDRPRLQAMSQAARSLARPDAADRLAQAILEVGHDAN